MTYRKPMAYIPKDLHVEVLATLCQNLDRPVPFLWLKEFVDVGNREEEGLYCSFCSGLDFVR